MERLGPVYVVGDVHGQGDKLQRLLNDAGLVGDDSSWTGEHATLCLVGDLVDRGAHGTAVIDLVRRWQAEAGAVGGRVESLIGNHEMALLAAHFFPNDKSTGPGSTFKTDWQRNGGQESDLDALTADRIEWLRCLPSMLHLGERLIIHADALLYSDYGASVAEVNAGIGAILNGADTAAWDRLLEEFSHRNELNRETATELLRRFQGWQIVHGHTPISTVRGARPATEIREPLAYADGLCVNVDGGMYLGGPGFAYALPPVMVAL